MNPPSTVLPAPSADAQAASRALAARIAAEIDAAGGWIGFDRYMQRVLYEPGLGYYSGGSVKLGPGGDFVTAPELGDHLARALAATLAAALRSIAAPVILELGAGSGALAGQLLEALAARGIEHVGYLILEPSAELRQRQRQRLAAFDGRVTWLDGLPAEPFEGVILANEVADAIPAACFLKRAGGTVPLGVGPARGGLAWAEGPGQPELTEAVAALENALPAPLPEGYKSEIRLVLPAWIRSLAGALGRGSVLLVDYGYSRRDYYRPERSGGTLTCHYRHRVHDDPFLYPGLQDVTAWVDFSACAGAARAAGLEVAGFTTQAQFVLEALGENLLDRPGSASPQALSALKTLLLPGEMGERFKVLLLTKNTNTALPGRDFRDRL